jgi:hypothetical protein
VNLAAGDCHPLAIRFLADIHQPGAAGFVEM